MLINESPFSNPNYQKVRQVINNKSKIKISSNEVSLQFLRSKDIGSTFKVEYLVNLNPKEAIKNNPEDNLSLRDIDNRSLKKAILNNIKEYDKRYMELAKFDHTKATFHLKFDKWLDDATKRLKPKKKIASFKLKFKLKQEPPRMIMSDTLRNEWSNFIVRKLKQWMQDNKRREHRLLNDIFPKSIQRKIRRAITNMFEWSYDFRWNTVEAKLENKWIIALLYATSKLTQKDSLDKIKKTSQKHLFSTKVKKNLDMKKFDKKKWKKLTRKAYF